MLPEGFYDQPDRETALADLEFGPVFCAVRGAQRWSQQALAEFLGWEQRRISAIETGKRPLVNLQEVLHVANKLKIPAGKLGFRYGVTVGTGRTAGRTKGSWVQRRNFVNHVAGLTLGLSGVVGLDIDRLIALLPPAEPTGTRHLGAADVETIEQATTAFVRQDYAQGSGIARDAAIAQLRATLPLLGAQMTPEVRPRLYLATSRLATQAGFMSFDAKQHDAARRLWLIGLNVARAAEDPLATDQTVFLLYDMAVQAMHLNRPDEALGLIHLGHAAAAGSHPISAATSCWLASVEARAHAARGEAAGCDHALGRAVEQFSIVDPATRPPWGAHIGDAHLTAMQGRARYELALVSYHPKAATQAVALLRQAVQDFGPDYARSRALYLLDLAGAHALAGDTDTAVSVGHQAIDAVTAVHSPRAYDRLHVLRTVLEPLHTSPGVAELRRRLAATAA
ncbi:MAG: helix-turn-helix transcriptional regulator [Streptosporangiaceae bacterium]|nr:helix-turn-helix transcriptional regulator [Streptosporangiaceae bacterium]